MSRSLPSFTLYIYLILGLLLMAGCAAQNKKTPSLTNGNSQIGMASWYGPSFHGKPSASGEPYDMWALTAAHRTLPFGTWVQVTKVETGKRVTVRINDRGPFINGRIIDLSYGAARELAMIGEGTAHVSLSVVSPPNTLIPSGSPSRFWVQAGAFTTLMEAMTLRERLASQYDHVRVQTVNLPSGEWHRVQVGTFSSKKLAQRAARTLQNDVGGNPLVLISN
jgi:peptidoglycan lytic transglycosylase